MGSVSYHHDDDHDDEEEVKVEIVCMHDEINDPPQTIKLTVLTASQKRSTHHDHVDNGNDHDDDDQYTIFKTILPGQRRLHSQIQELEELESTEAACGFDFGRDPVDFESQSMTPVAREVSRSEAPSARRYFAALQGPELETPKDCEELLLQDDKKWPLLLRIPIVCFGVSLGLGSQTILWKTLAMAPSMRFLHIPLTVNLVIWCFAVVVLISSFVAYALKCVFYLEAVKREYYHPVRVNFFFAPWISSLFLTLGLPPCVISTSVVHIPTLWCIFMAPILLLEFKIYGQWLSGGDRGLSKVANPTTHLSVVGNFVGALLAGLLGWKELALFFWAVGVAHYLVLFVTLYQRLPTAAILPKELHPVFFLFVAAPSTASVAWKTIASTFDLVSRIAYFTALFLYISLVVRVKFFRGFRFSFSWWGYTFPMTAAAIASIHYSIEVEHPITQGVALLLSSISTVAVSIMLILTLLHGLVWATLFPNDLAIAITTHKKRKKKKKKEQDLHNNSTWIPCLLKT